MKRLLFCLALSAVLRAQEKPQLIPPQKLLEFPSLVNPTSEKPVHSLVPPSSIELTLALNPVKSAVCSVPLLEAQVQGADPGIAVTVPNHAVAIPQARVPAPACETK